MANNIMPGEHDWMYRQPGVMGFPSPPPPAPAQGGGLLGKLGGGFGGLLGIPSEGLSPAERKAMLLQAMGSMGANLMAQSGWSPQRTSFGQALGNSLLATQQQVGQQKRDMMDAMLLRTKLQQKERKRPTAVMGPNGQPIFVDEQDAIGKQPYYKPGAETADPSAVREWQFFNQLPEDQQSRYLEMKRNTQPWTMIETADGKALLNRTTADQRPLTSRGQEAAAAAQMASSEAGAKVAGQSQTQAQIDMPLVTDKANEALGLIDQLRNHPGRKMATGGSRLLQAQRVPGTAAYDFDVMRSQVSGQQFLQAYETLKGGGQITEVEGQEAKNAIARMDAAQSEGAYLKALEDYERIIKKGVERASIKAGRGAGATGTWGPPTDSNVVNWEDL